MYNIINNVKCLFLQNSFFLSEKNRNFDIRVKNGTVFVTSSVEHKDKKNPVWFELPQCWTAHRLTIVKTKYEL